MYFVTIKSKSQCLPLPPKMGYKKSGGICIGSLSIYKIEIIGQKNEEAFQAGGVGWTVSKTVINPVNVEESEETIQSQKINLKSGVIISKCISG